MQYDTTALQRLNGFWVDDRGSIKRQLNRRSIRDLLEQNNVREKLWIPA